LYQASRANVGICYVTFDDRAKSLNTTMYVFMLTDLYMINILYTYRAQVQLVTRKNEENSNAAVIHYPIHKLTSQFTPPRTRNTMHNTNNVQYVFCFRCTCAADETWHRPLTTHVVRSPKSEYGVPARGFNLYLSLSATKPFIILCLLTHSICSTRHDYSIEQHSLFKNMNTFQDNDSVFC